ncbi:hypothetical protein FRC00_008591, partial [Tulasnella sp. 408]
SIASAEHIWFPAALGIIKDNVDPNDTLVDERFMRLSANRFLTALGLGKTEPPRVWYRIATRLLKRVEWTLGWWLGKTDQLTKGCLWRIFIEIEQHASDARFLRVVATQVEVDENDEYSFQLPPGRPLSITEIPSGISALELPGDDGWPSISVEGFVPLDSRLLSRGFRHGDLPLNGQHLLNADSPWYSARKLQDYLPHPSPGTDSWKGTTGRQWHTSFSDAPYPPPLLDQLLDRREGLHARDGPVVPSIALFPVAGTGITMETLLSIRRPSSFSKVNSGLVQTGIYVAPYGSHGWEFLLVRVRELTEDDFRVTWPWEGSMAVAPSDAIQVTSEPKWDSLHSHLGPFSGMVPEFPMSSEPVRVSRDHVRRGSRILEGIKIKGDPSIPGGQRAFIAFLDDPLVQSEALQEAEETFPDVSPERADELPWPFVSRAPTTTDTIDEAAYKQSYFSPERGIDIPGVLRSASSGFSYPQWTSCVVHVECKTKFTVASYDQIWFPVALGIIKDNVDPNDTVIDENFMRRNCNRFLATLGLSWKDTTQAWYRIATELLERVEWTLGWWLGKADGLSKGRLRRIFIEIDETDPGNDEHDGRFLRVRAARVEVVEDEEYTLALPPGGPLWIEQIATGISSLSLFGEDLDGLPSVSAEGFIPLAPGLVGRGMLSGYLSLNSEDPVDSHSLRYSARKLQDHIPRLSLGTDSWKEFVGRRWRASFSDAPYPTPLLDQLLDRREVQHARDGPVIPSIALLPMAGAGTTMETLLSIRRPSGFSKAANELVQTGIYVAPYGSHGWEYLLVRVRELTEDDLKVTWPWEGSMAVAPSDAIQTTDEPHWDNLYSHLGPFSGIVPAEPFSFSAMRVSRDHVRWGSRVLEGIKITGDANVPGGQRSFIAFLDDPLVQPEALQEAEETFPDVLSEIEDELPWPFVSQAPTTTDMIDNAAYGQSFFSPERGIDIPGAMRIADARFSYPQWTNCVVHVE